VTNSESLAVAFSIILVLLMVVCWWPEGAPVAQENDADVYGGDDWLRSESETPNRDVQDPPTWGSE